MDFDLLNQTYDRMSAIGQCDDTETISELVEQTAYSIGAVSFALFDLRSTAEGDGRVVLASSGSCFADGYRQLGKDGLSSVRHALKRLKRPVNREVLAREEQGSETLGAFLNEIGAEDFCIAPVLKDGSVVGGLGFQFASRPSTPVAAGIAGLVAPVLFDASEKIVGRGEPPAPKNPLTPRELECLIWSADGKTSWEISEILSVSERTVNAHLGRAIRKLGVVSRTQAVAAAMRRGLFR